MSIRYTHHRICLTCQNSSFESLSCYHSLSLLLIIFAIATLLDPDRQPYSAEAQQYYYLARTALGFNPQTTRISIQALVRIITPTPSCVTCIDTLQIHFAQYLEYSDWDSMGSNASWMYIGHAVRLGHSVLTFSLHFGEKADECSSRLDCVR